MPQYAFFDFDGTLIAQDSFLFLLKSALKNQPWRILFLVLFSPILLLTGILKLEKTMAKSCLLWSMTALRTRKGIFSFFQTNMNLLAQKAWFSEAIGTLEQLKQENVEVIIISASGTPWLRALLRQKFTKSKLIIGSRLGFFAGGVVLKSKNCYEEEKIRRIEEQLGAEFEWHSAWSDHIADLPMLKKAKHAFVVCPKEKHRKIFEKELKGNFTLLNWTVDGKHTP